MDWAPLLGELAASLIVSCVVSPIVTLVAFRIKFERFDATSAQRVSDWEKWRAGLEDRLNMRADHLAAHEKECRERWEKLLVEHGGVMERLRSIDDQLRGRRK